ncbi:MAG: Ig-like domain-containing protein [Myxococcota bacterium]|nr:Ig-like domain-containing protein [Myxococcota bacterium]
MRATLVILALSLAGLAPAAFGAPEVPLGEVAIPVVGMQVDVDTRPDVEGIQNTMTAVKDIPTAVTTVVAFPGVGALPRLPAGARVRAELAGPSFPADVLSLGAAPNRPLPIPPLGVAGQHTLVNVRLEDADGNVLLRRDPTRPPVTIDVISELLVTSVTSRALTIGEIRERGIVIDEDNFTVFDFVIGLTLGSEAVQIELPVAIPSTSQALSGLSPPQLTSLPEVRAQLDRIDIPNFSLSGFQMRAPPDVERKGIVLPPIAGVIVIPGNIAFLNQFFSVVVQASSASPEGSGLSVLDARATITLPVGDDEIAETGDDPLRIAETQAGGVQTELPLLDAAGSDVIEPQATHQAEFLVEGLREGTHRVDFDLAGELFVAALGERVPVTGRAAGVVQVANPSFDLVLAHPDVVREGEAYSVFATVTNTSSTPANLFQLALDARSLSGTRLVEGESDRRSLPSLLPGQAETFEFRLVARTTGEVTGTVFLADEGINGSFVLRTGVGDTGIPLSPDTLVLPQTVDYLPENPDLVFAAVRLLGQAYSVATAPAGALPPDIDRVTRSFVFDRAVKLAQAGLHVRFGESPADASRDVLVDYLGSDLTRLTELFPDDPAAAARAEGDLRAFDRLRRASDAGHDFSDAAAELLGAAALTTRTLAELQADWAAGFASRPAQLSFAGHSDGAPLRLQLSDDVGAALGRGATSPEVAREIPFGARLALSPTDEVLHVAAPEAGAYTFSFFLVEAGAVELSLVLPAAGGGMEQVIYDAASLPAGALGRMTWSPGAAAPSFQVDGDGDGSAELALDVASVAPIADEPPTVVGVHQWAKGARPDVAPSFEFGDPIGRMIGVLFSEEVSAESVESLDAYLVAGNEVNAVALQPDRRLAFLVLERPIGPFVERRLRVRDIADLRANLLDEVTRIVLADPDRGVGGVLSGQVVTAEGAPVPLAQVRYLQPLSFKSLFESCTGLRDVKDFAVTTYQADASGRFTIEYVLQSGFEEPCPSNADIWLNETNPRPTNHFKLEAADPETGELGRASSRIRFDGQRLDFRVVIRGAGEIEGSVVEEDGSPVVGGPPGTLPVVARNVSTGEIAVSWVDEGGRYAFPRSGEDADGERVDAPRVAVGNVILQVVRPDDGASAVASVNLPAAGAMVSQDLVMIPASRYGTVAGRVLESDGVTGAANVPVQIAGRVLSGLDLFSRSFTEGVVGATLTDGEGFFRFEGVPAGDVELLAVRQSTFEQADARSFLGDGEEQELLLVLPGSGGTVRGIVRDALGNPIAGATVAGGPTLTQTDENGFFEITGLPLGSFTIYGQSRGSPALGQIDVQSLGADDVQDAVITLEPVGSVQGRVFEADGVTPIQAQRVQLWVGNRGVRDETFTDGAGEYSFPEVPLGDYSVRAVRGDRDDGGQTLTSVRFAGDIRDADITFRGLGQIRGRVIGAGGTPEITDVVITRKVWRVIPDQGASTDNSYLEFVRELAGIDDELDRTIDRVLAENGLDRSPPEFFLLVDEPVLLSSDLLGPSGEVTGEFLFEGPVTGGPFTVAAFGPFLAPAEVSGAIPVTTDPVERIVDVGDIVLEPAAGTVTGTVTLPDGATPVGANVLVRLRSLDDSGDVLVPDGVVTQPVLPELEARTDENGRFEFPLALRGRVVLTADTGAPDPGIRADSTAEMETELFDDGAGGRLLNVRLRGQTTGVLPSGGTLEADIRLLDVAGARVQVVASDGSTPVPFAEVSLTTKSTLDDATSGFAVADADGRIDFFPVAEGMFSVSAREPGSSARGQANGDVPIDPPNGLEVPVTVTLGAVTTASGQIVPAEIFGSVAGIVFEADGTSLENPAQVTVRSAGVEILTTSDETGAYRADDVPGGFLSVDAFEPFTARRGSATGSLAEDGGDGQLLDVPVTLVGLGTVTGEVLANDGSRRVAAADVILLPAGDFTDKLVSRTDDRGVYTLLGVPLGTYQVQANDPDSGLSGEAGGRLEADGEIVTTDVLLEPSGQITGTVYAAGVVLDGAGQAPPGADFVPGASVEISRGGFRQVLQADAAGRFASGMALPLGVYDVVARPPLGADGASASIELRFEGEVVDVPLALRGRGIVEGVVLDSSGLGPVAGASVTLASESPFSAGAVTRITDSEGRFRFAVESGGPAEPLVPVGAFSLSVVTNLQVPRLGGAAGGELAREGELLRFEDGDEDPEHEAIRLQPAGSVRGSVLLADALTPAEGAILLLEGAGLRVARLADPTGRFAFAGIPLGAYQLGVLEPDRNEAARRAIELLSNGDEVAFEDGDAIVLDGDPPGVVATSPNPAAVGVPLVARIEVRFDEPVDPESLGPQSFAVEIEGKPLAGARSVVDGDTAVFTPAAPLPDLSVVRVTLSADVLGFEGQVLAPGVRDLEGNSLAADVGFRFTTGDGRSPALVALSPADGSVEVAPESVVRFEFDEPIDRASIAAFELRTGAGEAVVGALNETPISGDRVVAFTPERELDPNQVYTAVLSGPVRDRGGNEMAAPSLTTTFQTVDTRPPTLSSLGFPPGTLFLEGGTVVATADVEDASEPARVEFTLDGTLVGAAAEPPYTQAILLDPLLGPAVVLAATAIDVAGNRSAPRSLPIAIAGDQPPEVRITAPTDGSDAGQGESIEVFVAASDDVGLAEVAFSVNGGDVAREAVALAGDGSTVQTFSFAVPPAAAAGAPLVLRASATDVRGRGSVSAPVTLRVLDGIAPELNIGSPANGSRAVRGETLRVFVRADDPSGIQRIELAAPDLGFAEARDLASAGSMAAETFEVAIPADAPAGSVALLAVAEDTAGIRGSRAITVRLDDVLAPSATLPVDDIELEPGAETTITVRASDDVGVARLDLELDGVVVESRPLAPVVDTAQDFTITLPDDLAPGSRVAVAATATDAAGNVGRAEGLWLVAADLTPPDLAILAPAPDGLVDPGATVEVRARATDRFGVAEVTFVATGAATASDTRSFDPALESAEPVFALPIPGDASAGGIVDVEISALDVAGLRTATTLRLQVADRVPPEVVAAEPGDGAVEVPVAASVTVTFSEPLAPGSVDETSVTLEELGGAPVATVVALGGGGLRVTLTPALGLRNATTYRVTVTTGVEDLAGNPLATAFTSTFTSEAPAVDPPRLLSLTPEDGASGVSVRPLVEARFSEPLDPASLTAGRFVLLGPDAQPVPAGVELRDGDRSVICTPEDALDFDATYTVRLSGSLTGVTGLPVVDADGAPFAEIESTFTTGAFAIIRPEDGRAVVEGSTLAVEAAGSASLGIRSVVFTLNGEVLGSDTVAPFLLNRVVPPASEVTSLEIQASALDAGGTEIAADQISVPVTAGMRFEPRVVGIPLGGSRALRLRFTSPLTSALDLDFAASDPAVLGVPAPLRVPPGASDVLVSVEGLTSGGSLLLASSSFGEAGASVSVSGSPEGDVVVPASPVGVGLLGVPTIGGLFVSEGVVRVVEIAILAEAAAAETPVGVTSSDPDVVQVLSVGSIGAGERTAAFELVTGAPGTAELTLVYAGATRRLSVRVGDVATAQPSPVPAAPIGVGVLAPRLGRLFVAPGTSQSFTLPLLAFPAIAPTPVVVTSRDPLAASITPDSLTLDPGEREASFTVTAGSTPGEVWIDLQVGADLHVLRVVVDLPDPAEAPVTPAPIVGIEIEPAP